MEARPIDGRSPSAALAVTLAALVAACGGSSNERQRREGQRRSYAGNLTYWYWAESDAPGANKWMKAMIAQYQKLHPKVHIKLVLQATDTLIGAFKTASQTKKGPDIATQWATLPVLTPAWTGASVADLRLRPEERDRQLDRHAGEHELRQGLGHADLPARRAVRVEQGDVQGRRAGPEHAAGDVRASSSATARS